MLWALLLISAVLAVRIAVWMLARERVAQQAADFMRGKGYTVLSSQAAGHLRFHVRVQHPKTPGTFTAIVYIPTHAIDRVMNRPRGFHMLPDYERPTLDGWLGPAPHEARELLFEEQPEALATRARGLAEDHPHARAHAHVGGRVGARRDEDSWTGPDPVTLEVSRRLDQITSTPGALLRYDLNGDGQLDAHEWEALRQRVRAEVEAERAASSLASSSPADPSSSNPQGPTW